MMALRSQAVFFSASPPASAAVAASAVRIANGWTFIEASSRFSLVASSNSFPSLVVVAAAATYLRSYRSVGVVLSLADHVFVKRREQERSVQERRRWRCSGGVQGQGTALFFDVGASTGGVRASGLARVFAGDVRVGRALLAPLRGHYTTAICAHPLWWWWRVVTREIMASSGEVVKGLVYPMAAVLRPPRRTVPDTWVQRWTAIAFAVTNVIVGVWRSSRRAFRGYQQPRSDNHDDKGGGGAGAEDGTGGAGKASDGATRRHGRRPAPASFYLMCMRLLYHI